METVSSPTTFFRKFIFTTVWSTGFGLATVVMFLNRDPNAMKFAVPWVIGTAWGLLTSARLKRVKLDGANLVISNYWHDITVPVSEIVDVRQNRRELTFFRAMSTATAASRLINPRRVTITFKKETPFGSAVTFMPHASLRLFSEVDIVTRLRSLAGPSSEHWRVSSR